jgi:hypothetical protein
LEYPDVLFITLISEEQNSGDFSLSYNYHRYSKQATDSLTLQLTEEIALFNSETVFIGTPAFYTVLYSSGTLIAILLVLVILWMLYRIKVKGENHVVVMKHSEVSV